MKIMINILLAAFMAITLLFSPSYCLAGEDPEIKELKKIVKTLVEQNEKQQLRIDKLSKKVDELEKRNTAGGAAPENGSQSALDKAVAGLGNSINPDNKASGKYSSKQPAPAAQKLIDISYDVMSTGGWADKKNADLSALQAGGHDAKKRGFNLNAAELSLTGAVDPNFRGESHIVFTPGGVELEEAFLTSQKLPHNLQLKLGYFLNEFGRVNPTHPHSWQFIDKPVIASRLFGADGFRSEGMRLSWLLPAKWYSEIYLGLQNADSETAASFLSGKVDPEDPGTYSDTGIPSGIGGRPMAYKDTRSAADLAKFIRFENSWDMGRETTAKLGFSALAGPNGTGPDARTDLYGADLILKWRPVKNFRGWPFLIFESEYMKRKYRADGFTDIAANNPANALAADTLYDSGFYSQFVYGFRPNWAAGLRYEKASGSGESIGGRQTDACRDDRTRISPVLIHYPSEFSRIRLQYNRDRAEHLPDKKAGSVWMTYEIMYGFHPAHKF